jgi:hypothetical protein
MFCSYGVTPVRDLGILGEGLSHIKPGFQLPAQYLSTTPPAASPSTATGSNDQAGGEQTGFGADVPASAGAGQRLEVDSPTASRPSLTPTLPCDDIVSVSGKAIVVEWYGPDDPENPYNW